MAAMFFFTKFAYSDMVFALWYFMFEKRFSLAKVSKPIVELEYQVVMDYFSYYDNAANTTQKPCTAFWNN